MDTTEEQQDISLALAITDSIHQSIHALSQTQSEPSKRSFRTARLTRGLPPRVTRKTTRVAEATKKACLERQEGDREAIFDEERRKEHDQLPITIDDSSSINDQDTDYRPFSALTEADANASKNREAHTAAGKENASPIFSSTAKSTKSAPAGRSRPKKRKHGTDIPVGEGTVSTSFSNRSSLKEKSKKAKKPRSTKKQPPRSSRNE
ncbi:uncharacterized protein N7443_000007 [Penicillium atrosanguineum]|uniref:Uncharacterized protein n=1 Tax=Penicillium atrosanguineum TaxID=1132637 RepID=A0A9W9UB86_9EURO|nr:uncharacterized protein N7443_000007 [Penicillium atrosanguineum]KAJ5313123.1 hypothetical protein N7443_000007 [Penicillium atrosanguineum]KAJ5330227.1 hypothetical protein N7476_000010 [Penicillium atrosanguineum]